MSKILVLYATREGHTRLIVEHMAATLRTRGPRVDVHQVADRAPGQDLSDYAAVVLGASVHAGKHEPEMVRFVRENRAALDKLPTAFLSVSLSEAGAENSAAPAEKRAQAARDVQAMMERFFETTGWRPREALPVAGALVYTQYGYLKRLVMKAISKRAGGDTDTSRDYVYTDWEALDRFAEHLMESIQHSNAR